MLAHVYREAETDGLLFAVRLDGAGGATPVGWEELDAGFDNLESVWCHFDHRSRRVHDWLIANPAIDDDTTAALLATETRPRVLRGDNDCLVTLRGANFNEGEEPDDMVSMRMWSDGNSLFTMRNRRLQTPRDLLAELTETRQGPASIGALFAGLIWRLAERKRQPIDAIEEKVDLIEAHLSPASMEKAREEIADLRADIVEFRRFLTPQTQALEDLWRDAPSFLTTPDVNLIRESLDRTRRYLEDLDALRERALVVKDEIATMVSERMNRNTYALSVVAAIFLPLGFLTGLLGINVGGIPGQEWSGAFALVSLTCLVIAVVGVAVLKWLDWI